MEETAAPVIGGMASAWQWLVDAILHLKERATGKHLLVLLLSDTVAQGLHSMDHQITGKSLRPAPAESALQRQVCVQVSLKLGKVMRGNHSFSPWLVEILAWMRRSCGNQLL